MNPLICRPSKFCVSGNCREHFSLTEEHSLVKATYAKCSKLVGQEKTKMGEITGFPQKLILGGNTTYFLTAKPSYRQVRVATRLCIQ